MPGKFEIALLASAALAAATLPARAAATHDPLVIGSWGGAYQEAEERVLFDGFTSRTGIPVEPVTLMSLDSLRQALAGTGSKPSLVDLPALDAEQACAEGLAEPMTADMLPRDNEGATPERDFLLPAGPCGIPATLTTEVVLYDRETLAANAPSRASDLFDLKTFPGKRALKRDVVGTLEWALLADGVLPDAIYPTLATPAGVDRAFARLESIRGSIVWWEHGDLPIKALARKDVVMAAAFGARAYQAIVGDKQTFGVIWPGAIVSANRWVLLKNAQGTDFAREFVKFATDPQRLAALSRSLPYGPARQSALAEIPPEKLALLPSAPEHMAEAIKLDPVFWQKNGETLRQRFEAWLATPPKNAGAAPIPATAPPAAVAPAKLLSAPKPG